eukprot:13592047-Ditylum_brightwellii.AAC.1
MVHGYDCVQTDGTVFFNSVENGADGAEKHLVHCSQVAYCRRMEINNDVHDGNVDGEDDSIGNGDDSAVGAEKHL